MLKNKKYVVRILLITAAIIGVFLILTAYIANEKFRSFIDKYVLAKQIEQENVTTVDIETNVNNYVYAVQDHVVVLSGNVLKMYNSSGKSVRKFRYDYFKTNICIWR